VDSGLIWTPVELDPDQMNGETLSGNSDFRTWFLSASDSILLSFARDTSCHPTWFPEASSLS